MQFRFVKSNNEGLSRACFSIAKKGKFTTKILRDMM